MLGAPRHQHSYADYLQALQDSAIKLEYLGGEIYAMAGGTPMHAQLAASVMRLLGNALQGRCTVFSSDLKVLVAATGLATFPDVTVVCTDVQTAPIDANAVVNPTVIVEVTSDSTESYDFGEKLEHYKQIPSLQAVMFVSHRRAEITLVERSSAGSWKPQSVRSGAALDLLCGATIAVDDVYAGAF